MSQQDTESAPQTEMTLEEMVESLTGFEEIAISKQFGIQDYTDLPATRLGRAMVFAHIRRTEGLSDSDAYERAMNMTLKAATRYFADDEEITPDKPETDSGKDDSASDSGPAV